MCLDERLDHRVARGSRVGHVHGGRAVLSGSGVVAVLNVRSRSATPARPRRRCGRSPRTRRTCCCGGTARSSRQPAVIPVHRPSTSGHDRARVPGQLDRPVAAGNQLVGLVGPAGVLGGHEDVVPSIAASTREGAVSLGVASRQRTCTRWAPPAAARSRVASSGSAGTPRTPSPPVRATIEHSAHQPVLSAGDRRHQRRRRSSRPPPPRTAADPAARRRACR